MNEVRPSRLARWLLARVLPADTREFVVGDLDEEFARDMVPLRGARAARWWYWRQALRAAAALGIGRRAPRTRRARGEGPMRIWWQDLRFSLRALGRQPGFAAVAVVTLALGIGVNTAVFTWVKAVALDPLPGVPRASELVILANQQRDGGGCCWGTSYLNWRDYDARTEALTGIAGYELSAVDLEANGVVERASGTIVTGNYFEVLEVRPQVGRFFAPEEARSPGTQPVVVIGHGLWQRRFGGDPVVVGREVLINRRPFTVIGVAPAGFGGSMVGVAFDLFVPATMQEQLVPGRALLTSRGAAWLDLIARRAPGVPIDRVRAEMDLISRQIEQEHPGVIDGRTLGVYPMTRAPVGLSGAVFPVLLAMMAIVGLVLLIACTNVASLMLVRASGRTREMAVHAALGAGRGRLVRQQLGESLVLALAAGGLGLAMAVWVSRLLVRFAPDTGLPMAFNLGVNGTVLAYALGLSGATAILFGIVPALQASRPDLVPALKDGVASGASGRARVRSVLVVTQVALSVVALVTAGLFLRSLARARQVDPGFDPNGVLLVSLDLFPAGYDAARGQGFYADLVDRVGSMAGVSAATLARRPPLYQRGARGIGIDAVEGYQPKPNERLGTLYDVVGPGYLAALRIPLVRGRDFTERDMAGGPRVAIVNETMARHFWPDEDPVGRHVTISGRQVEVVGVAKDVKYRSLSEPARLYMYAPVQQIFEPDVMLVVRAQGDPRALVEGVRGVVRDLDPLLPLFNITTLGGVVDGSLGGERAAATGASLFGLLALLLATIGLYGLVAFAVGQRTREIGVRLALGATRTDVVRLVAVQGLRVTVIGLAIGLVAAAAATRFLARLLFGVSPTDPVTFAAVAALLLAVALAASWLPTRRAVRVDPVQALRYE